MTAGDPDVEVRKNAAGAVQSACTHFMTPRPENRPKFFWDPIWVPDNQKYQKNLFLTFLGGPGGPFSKNT